MTNTNPQAAVYQHFIPQFLLRNFSHPFEVPGAPGGKPGRRRKKGKGASGMPFPGDLVVSSADLTKDSIELVETPVKRILGQMDMYKDTTQQLPRQQHIEEMFSRIECRVSTIFKKIIKAHENSEPALWLSRQERNDVRKFLFLLKYRGSGFHRRFYHLTPNEYDQDDQELLLDYMAEKGFKRTIDVWIDNLKAIMEVEMDAAGDWMDKIRERIYPSDAEWFISHTQSSYMAICTPDKSSDEFILTDDCYNAFEGLTNYSTDVESGEVDPVSYIAFHEFAPISPALLIVLRSFVLPVPEEDADPEIRKFRDECRVGAVDNIYGSDAMKASILYNLPIRKARNSYSRVVNGRVVPNEGEDGTHNFGQKFCFSFFRLGRQWVQKINGIFLENAYNCTNLVFSSKDSFLGSLERYMTADPKTVGKNVCITDGTQRLLYLRKLNALMKAMGSDKTSVWEDDTSDTNSWDSTPYFRDLQRMWLAHVFRDIQKMRSDPSHRPNYLTMVQVHTALGGSPLIFWDDLEHVKRMWVLRVKIDSWSQGVDEWIRQRNRKLLTEAYLRCPPRRVWFYLKFLRHLSLQGDEIESLGEPQDIRTKGQNHRDMFSGPEDVLATAKFLDCNDRDMNRLLYVTVTNEIEIKKRPNFNLWENPELSRENMPHFMIVHRIVLDSPGAIRDCGIPRVSQAAIAAEHQLRRMGAIRIPYFDTTFLEEEEAIEIVVRVMVRAAFSEILRETLKEEVIEELKQIFFEFTYPTPLVKIS